MGIGAVRGRRRARHEPLAAPAARRIMFCVIVDNAVYVDGRRTESCALEEAYETSHERGGFAWISLYEPSREEFDSVAGELGLREMTVEDGLKPHSRPKVERYGD